MPRATINREETFHFDLNTCPGGFIKLRKLSFHEMTQRLDMMGKLVYETRQQTRGRRQKRDEDEVMKSMLETANVVVMEFEFRNSIVDHNLEDENGNLLDFSNALSLRILDPKVGAEIGQYIDSLNQVDDEDFLPLSSVPTSSSQSGTTLQSESTEPTYVTTREDGSE